MSGKLENLKAELRALSDPKRAVTSTWFFKTGPGEYGEGDRFRGIRVPICRQLAKRYLALSGPELKALLRSGYHEDRLVALLILVFRSRKASESEREGLYRFYVRNLRFVNNWDLVDLSAEHVVGGFLWGKDPRPLYEWARSVDLWERRVAILSTFHFIRRGRFTETLRIARMLLHDDEDLIHKAVGWLLREVGKRDLSVEKDFLGRHYRTMPRTMLRYAIERFPERERQAYLKGRVRMKRRTGSSV